MSVLNVYKKIYECGIVVQDHKINGVKGLAIKYGDKCGIFINNNEIKNSDEEFLVLVHEWGHCATETLHGLCADSSYIGKCEYRADRRAVLEFLPFDLILYAAENGCREVYEFSEFLNLPEEFIAIAFNHYRDIGKL